LKSLPPDDTHLKVQPMRFLNASKLGQRGAEIATIVVSRCLRCAMMPLKLSAPERAGWAALRPVGAEHEVVDDELALAGEEIG